MKGRLSTILALGLASFVDQAEMLAAPTLFPAIRAAWGLSEVHLGTLASIRSFLQTAGTPLWGYASDKLPRKSVLFFGTGIWGIWTLLCGLARNYPQLLFLRALSGLGLACLLPGAFSLVGDHFEPAERGRAIGFLTFLGSLGIVVGVLALGWIAEGLGWRWGFIILGLASVASGVVIALFVKEPPRGAAEPELSNLITYDDAKEFTVNLKDVLRLLRIPTFSAFLLQGVFGSVPWVVMGAMMMTWMVTKKGMAYGEATFVFAGIVVGMAMSSAIGGYLGDLMARLSPRYGRVVLAQISIVSGIPPVLILLTRDLRFWSLFALCFATALLIRWVRPGATGPMMQDVVLPELRGSACSLNRLVEGGLSSIGAAICGLLAERYGLTKALILTVPLPWAICLVWWIPLYFIYPADALRLRRKMAARRRELLRRGVARFSDEPPEPTPLRSPRSLL